MSALCLVLEVSSVMEEEVVEGDKLLNNLGMDDIAQIGGLVADQGDIAYLWAWTIRLREEDWSLAMVGRRRLLTPLYPRRQTQ